MKKVLFFVAVVSAFSFASCKKDRVCECTTSSTEPNYTPNKSTITFTDAKKGDARAACISTSYVNSNNYTVTNTCELK